MKTKTKIITIVILLIIILFFPIKSVYFDGGTKVYSSIMYKYIIWHNIDSYYEGGYKTGREFHFFPSNFKDLDYYYEMDIHPPLLQVYTSNKFIYAKVGSFEWCNKYNKCENVEVLLVDDFDAYDYFEVNKNDFVSYYIDGEIESIKIYKDSFTTRLDYNVKYDDENIYAPNFKGKYVLKVVIKSKYGKSDNYFGLNIK